MNPFDYVNNILSSTNNIMDENNEKFYNKFLTNRALSYFPDTILYAQEMNISGVDSRMQYDYLRHSVKKYRRKKNKWHKLDKNNDIEFLTKVFNCTRKDAETALTFISEEKLKELKTMYE